MLFLVATAVLAGQDPASQRFPDRPDQDALEYSIGLQVDVAHQQLRGSVQYTFAARAPLTTIRLDARRSDLWHVTFTTGDGKDLPAAWNDEEQCVLLTLPKPLASGEQIVFAATLQGTPVDGFYFKPNRYGDAMAFTDHYSIRARGWLPCEDHPADRAKFALHLTYPEDCEAIGFGSATAAPVAAAPAPAGYRTLDLRSDAEIPPYMWALVVGPFARVAEPGDPRLVDHLVYRQDVDAAKLALVHDAAWLQTMEQTFGPYAFGKYATVQCPTRWGGFEAPGNVQLAEDLFDGPDHGMGTLAHELVHMWFGDAVGYAAWREVWLSEGFASYFGPWLLAQVGGPDLATSMRALRTAWSRSRDGRVKTVRDDHFPHPDQALNANTYPKGAWVLHMLRGELGDAAFFAALKGYYARFRSTSITSGDFVAAIAASSGQQLDWFFAQWLDRVGCPELRVGIAANGGLDIAQTQPGEPYRCWLRLRWHDDQGKVQEQRVRIDAATQHVPRTGGVHDLEVDPDVELLFRPAR